MCYGPWFPAWIHFSKALISQSYRLLRLTLPWVRNLISATEFWFATFLSVAFQSSLLDDIFWPRISPGAADLKAHVQGRRPKARAAESWGKRRLFTGTTWRRLARRPCHRGTASTQAPAPSGAGSTGPRWRVSPGARIWIALQVLPRQSSSANHILQLYHWKPSPEQVSCDLPYISHLQNNYSGKCCK